MKATLILVATTFSMCLAQTAVAEIAFVTLRVEHDKREKPVVQIQWDLDKAGAKSYGLEEACTRIKKLPSWGSGVYVCLVSAKPVAAADLKKLTEAIAANHELVLSFVSIGRDDEFIQNYLKQAGLKDE
jgi:hypothetical protein